MRIQKNGAPTEEYLKTSFWTTPNRSFFSWKKSCGLQFEGAESILANLLVTFANSFYWV